MKMKKKFKLLYSLLAVVLCMVAFSVPAFASGDDWCEYGDYGTPETSESAGVTETPTPEATPAPEPSATPTPAEPAPSTTPETPPQQEDDPSGDGEIASGKPLTPSGNLSLVDDVLQPDGGNDSADNGKPDDELKEKQFITVQSKNGNYFYIVIDRAGDKENVYFLNQVDEADLMALIEGDAPEKETPVCSCTDKCVVGDINTACPVCQTTMSECTGKEPEPEPTPEPETPPENEKPESGNNPALLIVLVMALAGGGALYYFKFRKPKADTKGPVDLDDYDFGDDEDGNDGDYEFEPDDDEPEERNEGD